MLIDTVANSGIIVGAAGAAVAAAYGASTNLIVGFLLGGSASYVGGQLYGDRGYIEIYGNLIEALDCVDEEARKAYEPVRPIRNARRAVGAATDRLQSKYIATKRRIADRADIEDELAVKLTEAASMLDAAKRALNRADDYLVIEYGLADAIVGAVNRVVTKGNDQIRQRRPDADAFVRAAGLLSATSALKNANQVKKEIEDLRNAPMVGAAGMPKGFMGATPPGRQSPPDAALQKPKRTSLACSLPKCGLPCRSSR